MRMIPDLSERLCFYSYRAVPSCLWGAGSRAAYRSQNLYSSNPFIKAAQYLHITYTHATVYFQSSLAYL